MCDAPLCSPILSGHINRFALSGSQEATRALASSADGRITLLIPGLPVVHCTLSAAFLGPKRLQVSSAGLIGRHYMSISGCRKQKSRYRPRRCPMPQPILCLDEEVYHFAKRFDALFSRPQYQYLVTVLLGLMECDGKRTLSGLLHEVGQALSLSGLSRFFSQAPWEPGAVVACWLRHFRAEMQPQVEAKREQERKAQPKRRGRRKEPPVTGYLIGDDEGVRANPKGARCKDWASTTRRPMTNGSSAIVWCKGSICCWIDAVPWLHICTGREKCVKPKTWRFPARSS